MGANGLPVGLAPDIVRLLEVTDAYAGSRTGQALARLVTQVAQVEDLADVASRLDLAELDALPEELHPIVSLFVCACSRRGLAPAARAHLVAFAAPRLHLPPGAGDGRVH